MVRSAWIAGLLVLAIATTWLRLLGSFDNALEDARFVATARPPSGDIVFVEIDAASLARIGVWPWPRRLHAQVLDALMDAGAAEVVFDVDFSTTSNETDDALFAAALQRAGGYAYLAAFQQTSGADEQVMLNQPIARFAQYAAPVLVNVDDGPSGRLRTIPGDLSAAAGAIPALATVLAGRSHDGTLAIDFSIDIGGIDRVSVADLLEGKLDPARLRDRQVVVGASAIELRDFFTVPRFGVLPGPLVQIAASETLKAGRALHLLGWWPAVIVAGLLSLFAGAAARRLSRALRVVIILATVLVTEALALLVLQLWGIGVSTSPVYIVALGLIGIGLLDELAHRRRQQERMHRQREMMQHVLDRVVSDNFDGILVLGDALSVLAASKAAGTILAQEGELVGRNAADILPPELLGQLMETQLPGPQECECDIAWKRRTLEYVVTRSSVADPDRKGAQRIITCLTFHDITDRRRQESRLAYLARHDATTGAASRQHFVEQIDKAIARGAACTVVAINLGRLHTVNETLGHEVGDRVLRQVFKRIRGAGDILPARLGGDIFALAFEQSVGDEEIQTRCAALAQTLQAPYRLDEHTVILEITLGVATAQQAREDAAGLLRHADIALANAKAQPGGKLTIFTPALEVRIKEKQTLDIALRRALRRQEFFLVYQPQIDLRTEAVIGVEALVRWKHDTLGTVSPGDFIPLAEETGLIVQLGAWVMEQACRQVAGWTWGGKLSVNVSAIQFRLGDVVGMVRDALQVSGLSPDRLDIEITESLFAGNDAQILAALETLRSMGVGIAVDDFGTGYSSLSYLAQLPVDKIKVDQSFVRALPNPQSLAIVETIVAMAHRLGKLVIAEGIETTEQRDILLGIDCEVGQGYLFGRPVSAEALRLGPA